MAERGDGAAVPGDFRERLQKLFLDAARALMFCGAVAIETSPGGGNAAQALIGLLLWLHGVWLLSLVPVAGRYPRANRGAISDHRARRIGPAPVQQGHHELVADAARVLMLWSAAVIVSTVAGNTPADAARAFICLFLWLLGVCLLAPVLAADRHPRTT